MKQQAQTIFRAASERSHAILQHERASVAPPADPAPTVTPAEPFVLKAVNGVERERAVRCLANAVYYEAANEPEEGQRAVAQVVLNRVRDPSFPKSICGVVYQGWDRQTGCQFSFTCDGSLTRAPVARLMRNARQVAEDALSGHVEAQVGVATHYHADYVSPWWKTGVTRVAQIGAHIFYRWPGAAGALSRFTGHYSGGGEMRLSEAVLTGRAPRPTEVASAIDPSVMKLKTLVVADAREPTGVRTRVRATLNFSPGRPQPTADQVQRINAMLSDRFPEHPAAAPKIAAAAPAVPAARVVQAVAEVQTPAQKLEPVATAPEPAAAPAEAETAVSGG